MTVENFTTYIETDPASAIAVTATRVTFVNMSEAADIHVYKDMGVNHFGGDFEIDLTVTRTVDQGGNVLCSTLANLVDDRKGIVDALGDFLGIWLGQGGGLPFLHLWECDGGTQYWTTQYTIVQSTIYYLTLIRDETVGTYGTLYLYIYSDVGRTTLLNTQSITLHTSKKDFRYLYALQSTGSGNQALNNGYVENLEIISAVYSTSAPSVTTQTTTAVTPTTATGKGNVTSLGDPPATQYGHYWARHDHCQEGYTGKTENGVPSATGAYTSNLTGLIPNTLYYCRAYIRHPSLGDFYGAEVSFTTTGDKPVMTTDLATEVAVTTALGNGSVDNNGGTPVTQHGVVWSTSTNPTIASHVGGDLTTEGAVTGAFPIDFFSLMTGLIANTLYHYKTYATNGTGDGYGDEVDFTTLIAGAPIVTTEEMTSSFPTTAIGHGTVVDIGASAVTEHGHCWDTSVNPTTTDSGSGKWDKVANTDSISNGESFSSPITELTAGTAYHCRAYATNYYGTSYGNDVDINPLPAGEAKGNLRVLDIALAYTDKYGTRRYLVGVEY